MESKGSVFIIAGGGGIERTDTIKNGITKGEIILNTKSNPNNDFDIEQILVDIDEDTKISIGGFGRNGRYLPVRGDLVIITYKFAAIYLGEVIDTIETHDLDYIWGGTKKFPHKVLMKNVVQIFIPHLATRTYEYIFGIHGIDYNQKKYLVDTLENKKLELRSLTFKGSTSLIGNFQGVTLCDVDVDQFKDLFFKFCVYSKFEGVLKII